MAMTLHKEGRLIIPIAALIIGGLIALLYVLLWESGYRWIAHTFAVLGILLLMLVVNFFRRPMFPIRYDEGVVLAPANGKLVVVEEVNEEVYFKKRMLQMSIFMSPLDVHVNRAPVSGIVKWFQYFPGKYLVAWHPKSSYENEHTFMVVENRRGEFGVKQIAGAVARRIKWYITEGDQLKQGDEYGFIRFGSRVDVLLPLEVDVKAELESVTKAGRTILAVFPELDDKLPV